MPKYIKLRNREKSWDIEVLLDDVVIGQIIKAPISGGFIFLPTTGASLIADNDIIELEAKIAAIYT